MAGDATAAPVSIRGPLQWREGGRGTPRTSASGLEEPARAAEGVAQDLDDEEQHDERQVEPTDGRDHASQGQQYGLCDGVQKRRNGRHGGARRYGEPAQDGPNDE